MATYKDEASVHAEFSALQSQGNLRLLASAASCLILAIVGALDVCIPYDVAWVGSAASLIHGAATSWVMCASDVDSMKPRLHLACLFFPVGMLPVSAFCLSRAVDASSQLALHAFAIFVPPVAHSRNAVSVMSWTVGAIVHFCIVLFHFSDMLFTEGWQWLSVLLIFDVLLIDSTQMRIEVSDLHARLRSAYCNMADMAKVRLQRLFVDFCDADVALSLDCDICEPAPRLAAMLGINERQMQGRSFLSLLCLDDCDKFREYMEETLKGSNNESGNSEPASRSVRVNLMDAYGKPVAVILTNAYWQRSDQVNVVLLGISEAWQPKKTKPQAKKGSGPIGTASNVESSGFLMPLVPDGAADKDLRNRAKRPDSPRPGLKNQQ